MGALRSPLLWPDWVPVGEAGHYLVSFLRDLWLGPLVQLSHPTLALGSLGLAVGCHPWAFPLLCPLLLQVGLNKELVGHCHLLSPSDRTSRDREMLLISKRETISSESRELGRIWAGRTQSRQELIGLSRAHQTHSGQGPEN